MMKKRFVFAIVLTVLTAAFLTGCKSGSGLADAFDEEDVKVKAQQSIDYFNAGDYQSIMDMGNASLVASLTLEQWKASCDPVLEKLGSFESMEKLVVAGQEDKNTKDNYAVVVAVGKYSEGKLQFSIAFDEQMKIIQFLIQ